MENSVELFVAGRQRISTEETVEARVNALQNELNAKVDETVTKLQRRQAQIDATINELLADLKGMDIHQASKEQKRNLAQFLERINGIQADLKGKLVTAQAELERQKAQNGHLKTTLQTLNRVVRNTIVGEIALPPPSQEEASVEARVQQLQIDLDARTQGVGDELSRRNRQVNAVIDELLNELREMDIHEASRGQCWNLTQFLENLKETQGNLKEKLADCNSYLERLIAQGGQLQSILEEFRQKLLNTPLGVSEVEAEFSKIPKNVRQQLPGYFANKII